MDFRSHTKALPGIRNNNPGNLRPGFDWVGAVGDNGNFVIFESMEYGCRALAMDIINKFLRGLDTIAEIITVYAPPKENNTASYIAAVSKSVGLSSFEIIKLNASTLKAIMRAIINHENGSEAVQVTSAMIEAGMLLIPEKLKNQIPGLK